MRKKIPILGLIAAAVITCGMFGLSARADFVQFDLTLGNTSSPGISGYTGPFANVLVDRTDSTHATFTFTSLTSGNYVYLMGSQGAVAVNVNATSWTSSPVSGTNAYTNAGSPFDSGPLSTGGAGNEDGFGSFNQTFNSFDSYGHSSSQIVFTLTNTGGTWADVSEVLAKNASGYTAAAHIIVADLDLISQTVTNVNATGYATNGAAVPLPASAGVGLSMLAGFGGMFGLRKKLRRNPRIA